MSAATVFYVMEDEKGEDMSHPNAIRIQPRSKVLTMGDLIESFPLEGTYRFEFKGANVDKVSDAPFIWMAIDSTDREAEVPQFNGSYFANVIDLSKDRMNCLYSDDDDEGEWEEEEEELERQVPAQVTPSKVPSLKVEGEEWNAFGSPSPVKKGGGDSMGDWNTLSSTDTSPSKPPRSDKDTKPKATKKSSQPPKGDDNTPVSDRTPGRQTPSSGGEVQRRGSGASESSAGDRHEGVAGTGKGILSGMSSWAKSATQWAKEGGAQELVGKGKGIVTKLSGLAAGLLPTRVYTIRGQQVTEVKKLAEGGFSTVYLVKHVESDQLLALKKIICQTKEAEREALDEAKIHDTVDHPNVMPCVAWDAQPSDRPGWTQVFLLFPYYPAGSIFDIAWTAEEAKGAIPWPFPEEEALRLFLGICRGVQAFHKAGFVHRDIKPHNVLLTGEKGGKISEAEPILMDLGSYGPAVVTVKSRSQALLVQDEAASKCSLAYRAPELFDVPSSCVLDERRDVWSLGCTLYSMAFGWGPFENASEGVRTLAIVSGDVIFPTDNQHFDAKFSPGFEKLVRYMLNPNPKERPTLKEVISQTNKLIRK